jgi:hypothetical protein
MGDKVFASAEETIIAQMEELRHSIRHLKRSNDELKEVDPQGEDQVCHRQPQIHSNAFYTSCHNAVLLPIQGFCSSYRGE